MATYLLTWNPAKWPWPEIQDCLRLIETRGHYADRWGCGVTRRIVAGDRVFLMKLGREPRGLVGSGWAASNVYERAPWETEGPRQGRPALVIDVRFDTLLDPDEVVFPRAWLRGVVYGRMNWTPQASGVSIPADVAAQLEADWARFLGQSGPAI